MQVQIGNQTLVWGTPASPTPVCLTPADMVPGRKGVFPFTYVETNTHPDVLIPVGPYYRNQVSIWFCPRARRLACGLVSRRIRKQGQGAATDALSFTDHFQGNESERWSELETVVERPWLQADCCPCG